MFLLVNFYSSYLRNCEIIDWNKKNFFLIEI
jgi:hypothetical protein